MMINSTTRLGKNNRKNYESSEIGLLDQSRYIWTEKVNIRYANFPFPSLQLRR